MKTSGIGSFVPKFPHQKEKPNQIQNNEFKNILGDFVKDVNSAQFDSRQITSDFIEGKDVELHEVMITGQKAKTSLELLMQIRNKTVDMYKELTRMS
jgi:flagellar hook-basal body complex protein FliE